MPNMADITVKAADDSTDVVYSKQTPSAGDKSWARWSALTVGTVRAAHPVLQATSCDNGTRKARRVRTIFLYPKTRIDSAGNVTVAGGASSESSHLVPLDMTEADISEYVAQYANLMKSVLIQEMIKSGYAPS